MTILKLIVLNLLLLFINDVFAHQPDFSNLMIYEQNGKNILVIKSSLTAFEGEVDFHFKKGAYKTPEEFINLAIQHFRNNCFVIINDDTIHLINPRVILGHETSLFAELEIKSHGIESFYLKNTFFKDMPNNQCEFVFSLKNLPQYQYILNNVNDQEVSLNFNHNKWSIVEKGNTPLIALKLIIGGVLLFLSLLVILWVKKRKISVNS